MNIKEKIKEHGIKRILIVDDTQENLEGAKTYFENIEDICVDYSKSSKEAIQKIRDNTNKYDLIITDMEMETKESGYEVLREGILNYAFGIIATGLNYDSSTNNRHGPSTTLIPFKKIVRGKKTQPEVWQKSLEHAINYLDKFKLKEFLEENKTNKQKIPLGFADIIMSLYSAEKNN